MSTQNQHYKRSDKLMRRLKKQKHPNKVLVNQIIDEIGDGMKKTMPKYIRTKSGFLINLHDMTA